FFFFQAEDGIRDKLVTGVQTCALPILGWSRRWPPSGATCRPNAARSTSTATCSLTRPIGCTRRSRPTTRHDLRHLSCGNRGAPRSEERRVGKECRSRRAWYQERKEK